MSPGTFQAQRRLLVVNDKSRFLKPFSAWTLPVTHTANESVVRLRPLPRARTRIPGSLFDRPLLSFSIVQHCSSVIRNWKMELLIRPTVSSTKVTLSFQQG